LTRQITFRLTEDEYSQLEDLAHADERLLTDTARRIFRRGLPLEAAALRARGVVPPSEGETQIKGSRSEDHHDAH
jgi:hypothetical protein